MTRLAAPAEPLTPSDPTHGTRIGVTIHAVGDSPAIQATCDRLHRVARHSKRYRITEQRDTADVVLVVARGDGFGSLHALTADPFYRANRGRCVVYCEMPNAPAIVPGVYTGQPSGRWLNRGWAAPGPYVEKLRPSQLAGDGVDLPTDTLYSFVGSAYTHSVRERILALDDARAVLRDAAVAPGTVDDLSELLRLEYDRQLARSRFVLCPRGRCPASIRLYETLRAGRVPVLISDDWVLPDGPDWDAFLLRVAEAEVESIPELLTRLEPEAESRGRAAREAWEQWFADEVLFDRLLDLAGEVQRHRRDTRFARLWRRRILLSPEHLGNTLRSCRRRWWRGGRK